MAEATDTPEGEENGDSGSGKLIIFAAAGGLALLVLGGGAAFFLSGEDTKAIEEVSLEKMDVVEEIRPAAFIKLPDIVVNLSSEIDDPHYLKLKATLECLDEAVVAAVQPLMPRILDAFQVYLREMRQEDLHGSAAVYRLKEELLRRINLAVHPARVQAILFEEFVVQ